MTIEQKIKEIEGFIKNDWDTPNPAYDIINKALEIINELYENSQINKWCTNLIINSLKKENETLKAQIDRVRDIESLKKLILNCQNYSKVAGSRFIDIEMAAQAIQNYILGSENVGE